MHDTYNSDIWRVEGLFEVNKRFGGETCGVCFGCSRNHSRVGTYNDSQGSTKRRISGSTDNTPVIFRIRLASSQPTQSPFSIIATPLPKP